MVMAANQLVKECGVDEFMAQGVIKTLRTLSDRLPKTS